MVFSLVGFHHRDRGAAATARRRWAALRSLGWLRFALSLPASILSDPLSLSRSVRAAPRLLATRKRDTSAVDNDKS